MTPPAMRSIVRSTSSSQHMLNRKRGTSKGATTSTASRSSRCARCSAVATPSSCGASSSARATSSATRFQLIEGDRLSTPLDRIDSDVLMDGVQMDADKRRIGYWIQDQHPGDFRFYGERTWTFVPRAARRPAAGVCSTCIGWTAPGAVRGIPMLLRHRAPEAAQPARRGGAHGRRREFAVHSVREERRRRSGPSGHAARRARRCSESAPAC
jgi:hypothetical protein